MNQANTIHTTPPARNGDSGNHIALAYFWRTPGDTTPAAWRLFLAMLKLAMDRAGVHAGPGSICCERFMAAVYNVADVAEGLNALQSAAAAIGDECCHVGWFDRAGSVWRTVGGKMTAVPFEQLLTPENIARAQSLLQVHQAAELADVVNTLKGLM